MRLLLIADLAREYARQHAVRVHVVGILLQRFLGFALRLPQTPGADVELGKFFGQTGRVGSALMASL